MMKVLSVYLEVNYADFKLNLSRFSAEYANALNLNKMYAKNLVFNLKEPDNGALQNVGNVSIVPKNIRTKNGKNLVDISVNLGNFFPEVEFGCKSCVTVDVDAVEKTILSDFVFTSGDGEKSLVRIYTLNEAESMPYTEYLRVNKVIKVNVTYEPLMEFKFGLRNHFLGKNENFKFNQVFADGDGNLELSVRNADTSSIATINVKYGDFTMIRELEISNENKLDAIHSADSVYFDIVNILSHPISFRASYSSKIIALKFNFGLSSMKGWDKNVK